jgi:hypothetical protein
LSRCLFHNADCTEQPKSRINGAPLEQATWVDFLLSISGIIPGFSLMKILPVILTGQMQPRNICFPSSGTFPDFKLEWSSRKGLSSTRLDSLMEASRY